MPNTEDRSRRAARAWRRAAAVALAVLVSSPLLGAAINVEGVTDKAVYADSASFRVLGEPNAVYTASLNERSVPIDTLTPVTEPDYYELLVARRPRNGGSVETLRIRFIVRASERGNAEWGLPPWTPYVQIPSAASECAHATLTIVAPVAYPAGLSVPIVVLAQDASGRRVGINGTASLDRVPGAAVTLFRGVGAGSLPPVEPGTLSSPVRVRALTGRLETRIEAETPWRSASGTLSESEDWGDDARVSIETDLTIAATATLTIGARSVIALGTGVGITIDGSLIVNGNRAAPVVFTAREEGTRWGGIRLRTSASRIDIRGAILTASGADPSWFDNHPEDGHTHRKEEPLLLLLNGAQATLTDCFLFDGGQAGHGESSFLTMTGCLVQRFTTTGQFNRGSVTLTNCALIEFPSADAPYTNGDNDGLYLTGGPHVLEGCLIGWTLDDGLDAGGGIGSVTITSSWFESCHHEGLALSTESTRTVRDTVVLNCGQGIECGFGSLAVDAARCLLTANSVGARFGDNYSTPEWTYDGTLTVRESLLLYNRRDAWGMAYDTWEEHLAQMAIAGGFLTASDPRHGGNAAWSPSADAQRLVPFMPIPEGPVGVGIAVRTEIGSVSLIAHGIPVRLSSFTTAPVRVAYTVAAGSSALAAGTLEFLPGESLKHIPFDTGTWSAHTIFEAALADAVNAEITGIGRACFVRDVVLIPLGADWRYRDDGSDQGTAWRLPGFDDGAWKRGAAELGFGDGDEATVVDGGPSGGRYSTLYFRRAFDAPDPASLAALTLRLKRDDGAIVYINGAEVLRSNMPAGQIDYGTWSAAGTTGSEENMFFVAELPVSALLAGANTIAVEVHQSDDGSSDLSFDLDLTARPAFTPRGKFVRGDANGDGTIDLSDAVRVLLFLFAGASTDCADAHDANDSGRIDIADAVCILSYLFANGIDMPLPFPLSGTDTTTDDLGCGR